MDAARWARLIARIYEVSPLACPDCGAEMRILAFLTELPLGEEARAAHP